MGTCMSTLKPVPEQSVHHNQIQRTNPQQIYEKPDSNILKWNSNTNMKQEVSTQLTYKIKSPPQQSKSSQIKTPSIFWISQNLLDEELKYIENQIQPHIILAYKTVDQAKKQLIKHKNVVVICSLSLALEVSAHISKLTNVKQIICYCMSVDYYQKLKKQNKLDLKFKKGTKDQKQVISFLKNCLTIEKKTDTKAENTFVILNNKVETQKLLLRTISAIIQQTFEKEKKQKKNYEDIIKQYKSSPLAKVKNSFYNLDKNMKQLHTLQPYIKQLFWAIKQSYQANFVNKQRRLTCFRFDEVEERQIQVLKQGVGQILKNSTFLEAYTKMPQIPPDSNVLFEINYVSNERNKEIDYGFTEIREQNKKGHQNMKILFNCLNTFIVTKVEQKIENKRRYYLIRLQYGELAKIMSLDPSKLDSQDRKTYELGLQEIRIFKKYNTIFNVLAN